MHTTDLRPTRTIRPFPKFERPNLEGCFSVDEQRKYQDSMKITLKYLKIPTRVNFDLNKGDDIYVVKPPSADEERLKHLLQFLMLNKPTTNKVPDFVCFRGLLTMLMNTPYEEREPWIVLATKYKGIIFLCKERTEREKATRLGHTERDRKFMRYGFKFESFILSDDPSEPAPGSTKPVIEAKEFCAMFSTSIGGRKVLYGAEMDGVIAKQPCESLNELRKVPMVEVKVKRRETNERQVLNFYRFKAIKWWLQSFLVGIDSIHVGLRNDVGIVDEVQQIPIKTLTDEAKRNDFWHATVAVNFLNDFLKTVANYLRHVDNPHIVLRYQWDPCRSDFITCNKLEGERYTFLTAEYIKSMETV